LHRYQQLWTTYRAIAEAMTHEKFMYLAKAGDYARQPILTRCWWNGSKLWARGKIPLWRRRSSRNRRLRLVSSSLPSCGVSEWASARPRVSNYNTDK
jgi:hypothetical protein